MYYKMQDNISHGLENKCSSVIRGHNATMDPAMQKTSILGNMQANFWKSQSEIRTSRPWAGVSMLKETVPSLNETISSYTQGKT